MDKLTLAWVAFGLYVGITTLLAVRGMLKTKTLTGFALGNGDLGPAMVGITLAAAVASTATFVINPGFVYANGVSALMHLGPASLAGVLTGLIVFSKGFRRVGHQGGALTLPHWIGARYAHAGLRTYFAVLNLILAITFVVLIVKGSAIVMQLTLGLSYLLSLVVIVGFVFSYVLMGGTYAHVYTNAFQGALMITVALLIIASGFDLFAGGIDAFADRIAAQDANLITVINPASPLFNTYWTVFACGFIVGIGLVAQPHILTKALYLKTDRDMNRYLVIASVVYALYAGILIAGLYARVRYPEIDAQDSVMAIYLNRSFSPVVGVLISVALLAAGMSTLDGILVSASTIAANDIFLGALGDRLMPDKTPEQRQSAAFVASRWVLVAMGAGAFALALDPPRLVGIFAQLGIYGLVAASLVPIAAGIFFESVDSRHVFVAAVVGPLVHFTYYAVVVFGRGQVLNPAVTATAGILASAFVLAVLSQSNRRKQ